MVWFSEELAKLTDGTRTKAGHKPTLRTKNCGCPPKQVIPHRACATVRRRVCDKVFEFFVKALECHVSAEVFVCVLRLAGGGARAVAGSIDR